MTTAATPWIRTRLRAAPGSAAALAVLVLLTAFLAAALPRAVDAYEDAALRATLREADLADRGVTAAATLKAAEYPDADWTAALGEQALSRTEAAFQRIVGASLGPALDPGQVVYGVRNAEPAPASDAGLPRPTPHLDPRAALVAQPDLAGQVRMVSGRLPGAATGAPGTVEAAVTARTARVMGLRAGSVIHLAEATGTPLTVRVTGIVRPRSPDATYWNVQPDMSAPTLITNVPSPGADPTHYWRFGLLIDSGAVGVLPRLAGGAVPYWYHPIAVDTVTAHQVPELRVRLAALAGGPEAIQLTRSAAVPGVVVGAQGLTELLAGFARDRAAAQPLTLVAAVGVGTVALAVLLMAGGLSAERRRDELALLRARGGSLPGIAGQLLAETAVVAVPAAALGTGAALLLVPAARHSPSLLLGAAVAVVAALALPVRAAVAHRRPGPGAGGQRDDLATHRPSRRRTVAELTVAVVVAGAVAALRRRGTAGDGADLLTAAAPVLVAALAALVLLRLYPLPLRLLARPAARLPGAVAHLGLARAGRSPATAALPLLAVLVSLTVTSFGGSVLAGVAQGRDRAALAAVGADARIDALFDLPDGLAARVRPLPGVRDVVAARVETGLSTPFHGTSYDLVVVDPAGYARLASATGLGAPFPAAALRSAASGAVPAVVSPDLAAEFRSGTTSLDFGSGLTRIRVAAVRATTPAAAGGRSFVVVPAAAMARAHPKDARDLAPTTLFVTGGHVDGAALRATARRAAGDLSVTVRAEERASYGAAPLQSGTRRVYLAAVAAAAGYSVLALLLSLLRTAPQRRALLARLRTMGMPRREAQAVLVVELVPQALLAAVGGILVGLAVVPLLRPGMDLTALAFTARAGASPGPGYAVLRTDPVALLVPSAGLLVLACAALAAQAWLSGRRRGEGTDLRIGERA